jgi:tRNA(Ile)-lysidine synthase
MIINKEIREAIKRNFKNKTKFILAVSGGPDSQCLLKSFSHVAKNMGHVVRSVGVNHGLRKEADRELDIAEDLSIECGVPFTRLNINIEPGSNLLSRARDGRYEAIRNNAEKDEIIVTAHHADDRAETVLIRLLRGSGAGAMAVLPERSQDLFRPILRVRKTDVMDHLNHWKIRYANDPSNENEKYLRVWIRRQMMPMLSERSPKIVEKLCKIADDMLETKEVKSDIDDIFNELDVA